MTKRYLRIVALTLLAALLLPTLALAATGKVSTRTVTNLYNSYNATSKAWNELKTAKHRLNNTQPVYCLQHKATVPNSETYNLTNVFDSYSQNVRNGLEIIVTNGYPFNLGGLTEQQAEYATANAIRFWLSECGDSQFYNMTNLSGFSDSELRSLAAAGTITKKIAVRETSYIPVLQFSVELLIKARAQVLMQHAVNVSSSTISMSNSGGTFSGSTTVTTVNLNGGYTLDQSSLPAGSSVTGYTGNNGDTLRISIPASASTANQTYTLRLTGYDNRVRSNLHAYNHNTDQAYQRVLCVYDDTYECASASITIRTGSYEAPKSDLTITSLTPGASSYQTGASMTFTATVKNQGTVSAGASSLSLSGSGVTTQTKSLPALAAGGTTTITFTVTAPSSAQTLTVTAFADCNNVIAESNESNNKRSASTTIALPPYPDLVVTSVYSSKYTYSAGESFTVCSVIENQGSVDAGPFIARMTPQGMTEEVRTVNGVAAGEKVTVLWYFTAPVLTQSETRTMIVMADSTQIIDESNENNNVGSTTVTILGEDPDLTITSISTDAGSYEAGDTVTVTVKIKNIGKVDAAACKLLLSGSSISSLTKTVYSTSPNGTQTFTFQFAAPDRPGTTCSVQAFVDSAQQITEANENNNIASVSFEIEEKKYPDLTVTSVYPAKQSYSAGETVTIVAEIKNQGDADAEAFLVLLSPQGMGEQNRMISSLKIGESILVQWTFTAPLLTQTETRTLTVKADSSNSIEESDETNNTGTGSVTILGEKPDLVVKSVTASAQRYSPGDTVTITVRVVNEGKVTCPASDLRLFGEGMSLQSKNVSQLAPGVGANVTFQFTAPYIVGEKVYTIRALADPNNLIAEKDESNNTGSGTYTVYNPMPDLTITQIRSNKTEYESSESGVITVSVKNQGSLAVSNANLKLTIGDFYERTLQTGSLTIGETVHIQFTFTSPIYQEDQSVSVGAFVDPENTINESNESNNSLYSTIIIKAQRPDVGIVSSNATNWYAGKDVVVTATVRNYAEYDYPSVAVRLNIGSRQYEESIPLPGNGSNLAVFRLTLPLRAGATTLDFTVDPDDLLDEENEGNNDFTRTVQIVAAPDGMVVDPDLPDLESNYQNSGLASVPSTDNSDYHVWQEIRLENGSYVTKTYWARLQTGLTVQPDPRIAYTEYPRRMESGFGVEITLTTQLTTNYDHPEKLVGAQMAWVYAPESLYGRASPYTEVFDSLETHSGMPGDKTIGWHLKINPWSETHSRLHYTPLWFPDGEYILLNQSFYGWTPAGQLYRYNTGSVDILGDMYDRVTAVQGR